MNHNSPIHALYDPDLFQNAGHELIAQLTAHLKSALTREIRNVVDWHAPKDQLGFWPADFPATGDANFAGFVEDVLARSIRLHHPRFVGHQVSAPLPVAALFDLIGDLLNNGMAVYEMGPACTAMEVNLIKWLGSRLGFARDCGGILTSGGSLGNLTALLAARQAKAGFDIWNAGAKGGPELVILHAKECHYCVSRAAQIMGLGRDAAVAVDCDESFRMSLTSLQEKYRQAIAAGKRVIAVVASACSTSTGAFDPLQDIARFCRDQDLWLHVDAAHGGGALLSAKYRGLLSGIENADSVVWDLHKMSLMPALATAVLFKREADSYKTFAQDAPYLLDPESEMRAFNSAERTVECTKRMMALKMYGCLKIFGTQVFADYIDVTFDLARAFADLLRESGDFDMATEPQANIVCFRHIPRGQAPSDALQLKIRETLLKDGRFYLVQTKLQKGAFFRVSLMNPMTTIADLNELLDEIRGVAAPHA